MAPAPGAWASEFGSELAKRGGEEAIRERDRFLSAMPVGYAEVTAPPQAVSDWLRLIQPDDAAHAPAGLIELTGCAPGAPGDFRVRRSGRRRMELSSLLPVLESFGLSVVEAVPWHFASDLLSENRGQGGYVGYVDDIGVRFQRGSYEGEPQAGSERPFGANGLAGHLVEAIHAALAGHAEVTPLNSLVVSGGLSWREVNLLCAYRAYRRAVGGPRAAGRSQAMESALASFPRFSGALVRLFQARLCPAPPKTGSSETVPVDELVEAAVATALNEVPDLQHFEALQDVFSLVRATTRSTWALGGGSIALKLAGQSVPFLPEPRPWAEVFVWSPWFEGVHLRFGPIARGGLRWSDRPDEMRPEVLGLARAQVKKNSLIVPTGAKGGFALREESAGPEAGARAYVQFVSALLDLTDNLSGGKVVHPPGIVCLDGDDPYLVVAADKGTAKFSDLANEVSSKRGFWLGDAFASGGTHGYDHKALGITARSAWLGVRRHFRALGMDAQRDELRVVGVGDMSGDVFGNGMLQSTSIKLVAAFDHRHIFVDPSPGPVRSFRERQRLSMLPRSTWSDFDLGQASASAIVVARQAKTVDVSREVALALGTEVAIISPPQLVKAVLRAPVDLIFFGGIGTFAASPEEGATAVDDEANDEVRVSAAELRARVVSEGANLAVTQRARVAYARRGGRINTDFIDNAGGVAMSDREVNLKILLSLALDRNRISPAERDRLLQDLTEEVTDAVLSDVEGAMVAIDLAAASAADDLAVTQAMLDDLEAGGLLEREIEDLSAPEELARRQRAGAGLSRPELAVITAYARSSLARSIEGSPLPAKPMTAEQAYGYFPVQLREKFGDLIPLHPLFAQLIASQLANEVLKSMGPLWAYEVSAEMGCPPWVTAEAFQLASRALEGAACMAEIDKVAPGLELDAELALRKTFAAAVGHLARWYLSTSAVGQQTQPRDQAPSPVEPGPQAVRVLQAGGKVEDASPSEDAGRSEEVMALTTRGVPPPLAVRVASLCATRALGEVQEVARNTSRSMHDAVVAWRRVDADLGLGSLYSLLERWPGPGRWARWQLHLLMDEIARARASAAAAAMSAFPDLPADLAVSKWLVAKSEGAARAKALAGQLHSAGGAPDVALAAVTVSAFAGLLG